MSSLFAAPFATAIQGPILIEFDSTPREVLSGRAEPTDHPIEEGAIVSDHVIDVPDEIEITGIVSNRPILALAGERLRSIKGGTIDQRAEDAYGEIVRLRKTRTLVNVTTELRDYEDMIILSETANRDASTGKILDISIRLREFRTATIETVAAPLPTDIVDAPTADLGPQQTKPVTETVEETSADLGQSWAAEKITAFGGQ